MYFKTNKRDKTKAFLCRKHRVRSANNRVKAHHEFQDKRDETKVFLCRKHRVRSATRSEKPKYETRQSISPTTTITKTDRTSCVFVAGVSLSRVNTGPAIPSHTYLKCLRGSKLETRIQRGIHEQICVCPISESNMRKIQPSTHLPCLGNKSRVLTGQAKPPPYAGQHGQTQTARKYRTIL